MMMTTLWLWPLSMLKTVLNYNVDVVFLLSFLVSFGAKKRCAYLFVLWLEGRVVSLESRMDDTVLNCLNYR